MTIGTEHLGTAQGGIRKAPSSPEDRGGVGS